MAAIASEVRIRRGPITVAVMLAALMQVLDMTIANVALPHMMGSFSTDLDSIKLVLTSYIVAAAVFTPMMGWLSERFGRRNLLIAAIVGFVVCSFIVGASTSLTEIVIARIFQGIAGAAFSPVAQAILLDTYPREKHGMAMAIYAIGILVGPIAGPTLGGYITEFYSWRWCFFINIPIGLITLLMVWNFVPRRPHGSTRPFDTMGFVILGLGLGCLAFMIDRGNIKNWFASTEIVVMAIGAACLLWMYPWYASLRKNPFIRLELFRDRNFSLGILVMLLLGLVLLGTGTLLPPLMQNILDYPVFTTGLILAPRGLGAMVAAIAVGRLITRINPRYLLITGFLVNAFALFMLSNSTVRIDSFYFVWVGFVQGVGLGLSFVPLTTMTFFTLPARLRDEGTAIFNLIRNVGSAIGISIVFTLLTRHIQINHEEIVAHLTPFSANLQNFLAQTPFPRPISLALLNGEITRQAAMISYNDDFLLMAGLMLIMIPLALAMRYHFVKDE